MRQTIHAAWPSTPRPDWILPSKVLVLRDAVESDFCAGVAARRLDRGAEAQHIPPVAGMEQVRQHGEALPTPARLERRRDIEEIAPLAVQRHEVVQHDMDAPAADRGLSVRLAEQPAEAFEDRAVVPGRRKNAPRRTSPPRPGRSAKRRAPARRAQRGACGGPP